MISADELLIAPETDQTAPLGAGGEEILVLAVHQAAQGFPHIAAVDFLGDGVLDGAELVSAAFSQLPHIGRPLLLFGILTFAYATILGWSCCGERCLFYLSGNRLLFPYRFLWILVIVFSPVLQLELVWSISDALNALMALPNILAVLLLSREIARDTRYYLNHLDEKA